MREYLKDKDFIANRIAKRTANKKEMQKFFVHIGPTLRVLRDKYNITLVEKRVSEEKNAYVMPIAYFSTPLVALPRVAKEKGATDADLETYKKKVKGITVAYEDGLLKLTLPEDFKADPVDINADDDEE